MEYSAVTFAYNFKEEWQRDLFEQALADIGFDSFCDSIAYIPSGLLNEGLLRKVVSENEGVQLIAIGSCEDKNWNAVWEAEHPIMELPLGIRIMPHCAFGAGYHETTNMLINRLADIDHVPAEVLDNGCGTGVLGIMAARCGAKHVTMVDIDDKSVANTKENIELNKPLIAGTTFTILQVDTPPAGKYDLILSNIHRNILLEQMPLYAQYLNLGGELWLSGFYEQDCPALLAATEKVGLKLKAEQQLGEWKLLVLYQPLTEQAA